MLGGKLASYLVVLQLTVPYGTHIRDLHGNLAVQVDQHQSAKATASACDDITMLGRDTRE